MLHHYKGSTGVVNETERDGQINSWIWRRSNMRLRSRQR